MGVETAGKFDGHFTGTLDGNFHTGTYGAYGGRIKAPVKGEIHGTVNAFMRGHFTGNLNATFKTTRQNALAPNSDNSNHKTNDVVQGGAKVPERGTAHLSLSTLLWLKISLASTFKQVKALHWDAARSSCSSPTARIQQCRTFPVPHHHSSSSSYITIMPTPALAQEPTQRGAAFRSTTHINGEVNANLKLQVEGNMVGSFKGTMDGELATIALDGRCCRDLERSGARVREKCCARG
ncbi:hypothetical protein QBC35DRAFT_555781 [Podospora australis]|uniref:Uncharacterized protein n=1 Tax=Podospora australis TaxID=1536484 RepID=A0AAN7AGH5_9PEZI|nr:hypothetical protein QBC35DRAFT_555781 [Podospora australis]